jgi:malate synthase
MEDAATAEISRSQVWQWLRHEATLDDGRPLTAARFKAVLSDELAKLPSRGAGRFAEASELFERIATSPIFEEFLTLPAYDLLLSFERHGGVEPPDPPPAQHSS